jgi:YcaO-like protein with predicted kinase domain
LLSQRSTSVLEEVASRPREPKVLRQGTHRSQTLEQSLARVLRLAPIFGITRVANVTGLDSVGIPVVMVSRPNSRSVTVSQGKGVDLASARVSGLMESAELYHAETITAPLRLATYEELRYRHAVVDVNELPRTSVSRFHRNLRLLWCEGRDLFTEETVLVPYEVVHTCFTTPLPDGHGCFMASSNGLASGNDAMEAISHGICEVVERDAATLSRFRPEPDADRNRLDLASVDDALCREIIRKFESAGLAVAVWDITSDIEIATFACSIVPREEGAMWHPSADTGHGCHPDRRVALLRALTEAAQTRLTLIAGLRDDFGREIYEQLLDPEVAKTIRQQTVASTPTRRFEDVPHWDGETMEDDVEWELTCLKKVGVSRVIAVDLTKTEFGLPVFRVIVPGLEGVLERGYVPGRRARLAAARNP